VLERSENDLIRDFMEHVSVEEARTMMTALGRVQAGLSVRS
jgi:hypothetical protein